jgi:TonB-dependent starch-binding outer membrane protein SusC
MYNELNKSLKVCKFMKKFNEKRKMKQGKRGLITLFLIAVFGIQLIFTLNVHGQQTVTVSGTVTDTQGQPLPGVTVVEEGTTNGTVTNTDGVYTITVPENATLVFSFVGMRTQRIAVNSRSQINILMEEETIGLEEVVAIGYGRQRRRDITGSVSSVNSQDIENRPIIRIEEALQGMVSGLNVMRGSGQPGSQSIDFKIRGVSTFSSNPVLTLIDGVPSSLDKINPNDIESISVLKDAASAAIYGSRATGGVILVTTKTGKKGKLHLQYSGMASVQSPSRFPEKVSAKDHVLLANEARANDGLPPKYSEEEIQMYSSPDFKGYDWDNYMLSDALQTNQNISMSGGNEYSDYYLSFGYLYQDGIVLNSDYQRYNIQLNHNLKITRKLKLRFKGGYSDSYRTAPSTISFGNIAQKSRLHEIRSVDGKWLKHPEATGGGMNPIAMASEDGGQEILKNHRVTGNFSMEYNVLPDLTVTGTYGLVLDQYRLRNYQKKITYYDQFDQDQVVYITDYNVLKINNYSNNLQNASLLANYSKSITNHKFTVLGGITGEWYLEQNDYVSTKDFLTDEIYAIDAGSNDPTLWEISGGAADWALASVISRLTYSYKQKYLFSGTIRYDGSSRFKKDLRWGLFPSASVGWILTQENFLRGNDVLTFLKLRGSWGQVGNQNVGFYPFANTLTQSTAIFNGVPQRSVSPSGAPNPLLGWETKKAVNIGIEGMFSNLLEFNVDLFKERTDDILLNLPVPRTFGQSAPVQNAGIVENKGWELELKHRNTFGEFNYGVMFQVSDATNKIIDLKGISPQISSTMINEEGYPMNEWFGLKAIGMFQTDEEVANSPFQNPVTSPGDLKFEENGGDPNTITSDDRIRLGRSDARFPFGIRVNLKYKNFDLTAFGQGIMSHLVRSQGHTAEAFESDNSTVRTYHLDRWTPDNRDAQFPKLRNGQAYTVNSQFSSFWLEDASYFRLKQIELGYGIPDTVLKRIKIKEARIFVSAENLFVFTKYLGYDPELPTATSYPLPKLYNIGINFNF